MFEKILYYLVLPFAVVFFSIFGLVGNVYALEVGEVQTRQIDHARFWHSSQNPNTNVWQIDQNSLSSYSKFTNFNRTVYSLGTTATGLNNTFFQYYTIPINSNNIELYQEDLSIHFTFKYSYQDYVSKYADKMIPFMSFNLLDLMNDTDNLNAAKDLIGFNGELYDTVEIDQSLLKTNYLFFYYPKVSKSCSVTGELGSRFVCEVTFNFPSNYFQDIPINEIYFGFWNLNKSVPDPMVSGLYFYLLDDYEFWYENPPVKPTPTPGTVEDIKDSLTSEELPDVNNAFGGINLDTDNAISSLILLPIKFLQRVLNLSSGICEQWDLDFGITGISYKIHLPCLNIGSMLGTQLWNTIDFLCCFFMIYNIIMLIISAFEDITSLRDTYNGLYQPKHAEGSYQPKHARE